MRLCDYADPPVVLLDERLDHPGPGVRLAGAGRPLHRDVRVVEVE